jgi:hypothetical protein
MTSTTPELSTRLKGTLLIGAICIAGIVGVFVVYVFPVLGINDETKPSDALNVVRNSTALWYGGIGALIAIIAFVVHTMWKSGKAPRWKAAIEIVCGMIGAFLVVVGAGLGIAAGLNL